MPEVLQDIFGRRIRLTDEREAHIITHHPYMAGMMDKIGETLLGVEVIRRSLTDPETVRLYYKWYYETTVGEKWVCVVVKILEEQNDAFVMTAFAPPEIKEGEQIWPT